VKELIWAIAVLPMAACNMFTPVSGLVTCSDASELGGGLCASNGLTEEGENVLNKLNEKGGDRENVRFGPAGSCTPASGKRGPRVIVISLFDGVGAMTVALSRLECQVVGHGSSEVDPACKRLTRTRWPGIIELGNITAINDSVMEKLSGAIGYKADLVLVGAGSPCQDLSSLNAEGEGLMGAI
jgi:hypothetical protein